MPIISAVLLVLMQGGSVSLSWTPSISQNVTSQIICRSTSSGTEDCTNPIATFNDNTTDTYKDTTVIQGVAYYYVAEACAGTSCSVPSNEVSNIPDKPVVTITPQ